MQSRISEGAETQNNAQTRHHSPTHAPATRLYRHALESILGMLTLGDLSRILAVSREWSAAVLSMKPIGATIGCAQWRSLRESSALRPLSSAVVSTLLRHLTAIRIRHKLNPTTPMDNASLSLLEQHTPNLQSLGCELTWTSSEPLVLPAKLTTMELQLNHDFSDAAINGVLTALTALPLLSHLHLALSAFQRECSVDVSILAACPSLNDLTLETLHGGTPLLTAAQLDQIRSTLGHLQRISAGLMNTDQLAGLLQPPVTARWRDIGSVQAGERTGQLLLTLQTVTNVDLRYTDDTAHVDFLPQLLLLAALCLDCYSYDREAWTIPADAVLVSLLRCDCLTELNLTCGFNSAHWSTLFAKLSLKKLRIHGGACCALATLECFAAGPITESLEELSLDSLALPPSELPHLYQLRRLHTLHLDSCFSPRLDEATVDSVSPPTPLLPALTELFHACCTAEHGWSFVVRHGPSLMMQQQLPR